MRNRAGTSARLAASLIGIAALAACQTMPEQSGFNQQQIAVLTNNGFVAEGDNYELGLASKVLFDFDSSDLKSETKVTIAQLTRALTDVGIGGATIEGHTDSEGEEDYNRELSERRAETVKAAFIAGGMDAALVRTIGYGESDPIEDNSTEEGRAENRRVVIVVSLSDVIRY